jgi:hypothetical protein
MIASVLAGALVALSLCLILLVANRLTGLLDSDMELSISSVVVAGPVAGAALWLTLRRTGALTAGSPQS